MKQLPVAHPCLLNWGKEKDDKSVAHPELLVQQQQGENENVCGKFQFWLNVTMWFFLALFVSTRGKNFEKIIWKIKIYSVKWTGAIKLSSTFHISLMPLDGSSTSPPFCTFGWKTNQCLFTKGQRNNQCCLLKPEAFFHVIILWGAALLHLASMHSNQCGSAKNVIKRWVINLMLVAQRQNKTALISACLYAHKSER